MTTDDERLNPKRFYSPTGFLYFPSRPWNVDCLMRDSKTKTLRLVSSDAFHSLAEAEECAVGWVKEPGTVSEVRRHRDNMMFRRFNNPKERRPTETLFLSQFDHKEETP